MPSSSSSSSSSSISGVLYLYWIGVVDTDPHKAENWSYISGGASGSTPPSSATRLIYDGGSAVNCTLTSNLYCDSFDTQAAYTGTIDGNGYGLYSDTTVSLGHAGSITGLSDLYINGDGNFAITAAMSSIDFTICNIYLYGSGTLDCGDRTDFLHRSLHMCFAGKTIAYKGGNYYPAGTTYQLELGTGTLIFTAGSLFNYLTVYFNDSSPAKPIINAGASIQVDGSGTANYILLVLDNTNPLSIEMDGFERDSCFPGTGDTVSVMFFPNFIVPGSIEINLTSPLKTEGNYVNNYCASDVDFTFNDDGYDITGSFYINHYGTPDSVFTCNFDNCNFDFSGYQQIIGVPEGSSPGTFVWDFGTIGTWKIGDLRFSNTGCVINFSGTSYEITMDDDAWCTVNTNGNDFRKVTLVAYRATGLSVSENSLTLNRYIMKPGIDTHVQATKTLEILNYTSGDWNGDGADDILLRAIGVGQWLFKAPAGVSVSYVNVQNSDATPGFPIAAWDGTNTDSGNNDNWLFTSSSSSSSSCSLSSCSCSSCSCSSGSSSSRSCSCSCSSCSCSCSSSSRSSDSLQVARTRFSVQVKDPYHSFGMEGFSLHLYEYPVTINSSTYVVTGTAAKDSDGEAIIGTDEGEGIYSFADVSYGTYAIVVYRAGILPQVLNGYDRFIVLPKLSGEEIAGSATDSMSLKNKLNTVIQYLRDNNAGWTGTAPEIIV
jgi:hypothetical protein